MQGSRTFRYLPLIAFLVVYALSCVIGALLFIGGDRQFIALFEYFSGTHPPTLTAHEETLDLILLFAAPTALGIGYGVVEMLPWRHSPPHDETRAPRPGPPTWLAHAVFWILAAGAVASLAHSGALGRAHSWLDYSSWIHARAANFQNLYFAEFVNLYVLVPTAAAWVVVATRSRGVALRLARWLPPLVAVLLALLLYMRKAAIADVLLVAFAWIIDLSRRRLRGVRWLTAGTVVAVAALYFIVVVAPVYSKASHAVAQAHSESVRTPPSTSANPHATTTVSQQQLQKLAKQVGFHTRSDSLMVYALVSPLTRSSAPALWYPVIFPRRHPYYHLDVGQDILGFGSMPNDNIVVWNYLNPTLPGGTEMVPYQFVLYSQGGAILSVGLSIVVGALLAAIWRLTQSARVVRPWDALLGALTVLLAVYIGIDSLRNSVLVSYGVIWGFAMVGVLALVARAIPRVLGTAWLLSRRAARVEAR